MTRRLRSLSNTKHHELGRFYSLIIQNLKGLTSNLKNWKFSKNNRNKFTKTMLDYLQKLNHIKLSF